MSASCTHFGCGIASTVCDEVATCACHGAQFHVTTGDVLTAPALDQLPRYKMEVVQGRLVVSVPLGGADSAPPKVFQR